MAVAIVISKPVSSDMGRRSFMVRRYPCPALSGLVLFFPNCGFIRLRDRLGGIGQRRLRAARVGPDEIADQHKIRAGRCECGGFLARGGEADAGRLEQFVPPLQAFGDRLHRRPLAAGVGLAEQAHSRRHFRLRPSNRGAWQGRRRRQCGPASATARHLPARRGRSDARHRRPRAPPVRHGRRAAMPRRRSGSPAPASSHARSWCAGRSSSAAAAPPRHRPRPTAPEAGSRAVTDRPPLASRDRGAAPGAAGEVC